MSRWTWNLCENCPLIRLIIFVLLPWQKSFLIQLTPKVPYSEERQIRQEKYLPVPWSLRIQVSWSRVAIKTIYDQQYKRILQIFVTPFINFQCCGANLEIRLWISATKSLSTANGEALLAALAKYHRSQLVTRSKRPSMMFPRFHSSGSSGKHFADRLQTASLTFHWIFLRISKTVYFLCAK